MSLKNRDDYQEQVAARYSIVLACGFSESKDLEAWSKIAHGMQAFLNVRPKKFYLQQEASSLSSVITHQPFCQGSVVEINGLEASGKTTLALHVIAEAQKQGGYCVFVDAEHALDPSLAEAIGVYTRSTTRLLRLSQKVNLKMSWVMPIWQCKLGL